VLDIDETSLTNWPNLLADDFGFVADGTCDALPAGPCGFNQWILKGSAKAIEPARKLFDAARAKGVAVIFITARPNKQRDATILNLDHAGFEGWTELRTRPDRDDLQTVQEFKRRGLLLAASISAARRGPAGGDRVRETTPASQAAPLRSGASGNPSPSPRRARSAAGGRAFDPG